MLTRFCTVLFAAVICFNGFAFAQKAGEPEDAKITKAEAQEAQDVAKRFTARFLETGNLMPLLDEFYFSNFTDRYKKFQSKEDNKSANNFFISGLFFDSKVISEGSSEEWRRFYVSAHNFVLLPIVALLKQGKDNPDKEPDLDAVNFYSSSVAALFDKNPNLANVIQKKGDYKPIRSAQELRDTTATLEQGLAIIKEKRKDSLLLKIDDEDLTKIFAQDYFKPELELADDDDYGFPKDTRFIVIKTPILMRLILAKDKDKLKIVYATLSYD